MKSLEKTLEQIRAESPKLREECEQLKPGCTASIPKSDADGSLDALLNEHMALSDLKASLSPASGQTAMAYTDQRELTAATQRLQLQISDLRARATEAGLTIPARPVFAGNVIQHHDSLLDHAAELRGALAKVPAPTVTAAVPENLTAAVATICALTLERDTLRSENAKLKASAQSAEKEAADIVCRLGISDNGYRPTQQTGQDSNLSLTELALRIRGAKMSH